MSQGLIERVLFDGRSIIADRRRRLRGSEAVDAAGVEVDPCDSRLGASARSALSYALLTIWLAIGKSRSVSAGRLRRRWQRELTCGALMKTSQAGLWPSSATVE